MQRRCSRVVLRAGALGVAAAALLLIQSRGHGHSLPGDGVVTRASARLGELPQLRDAPARERTELLWAAAGRALERIPPHAREVEVWGKGAISQFLWHDVLNCSSTSDGRRVHALSTGSGTLCAGRGRPLWGCGVANCSHGVRFTYR